MGAESSEVQGPELSEGVPLASLPEGAPFAGHVGDEQVVVVKRGEEVFAIGASCTHYGGPLAEGLVVDDTIRCPWHHACFSLRTGEALGAPALNPVSCWQVEVRDGKAFVRGGTIHDPLANLGRSATEPESVVIIGAGAAGSAAAEMHSGFQDLRRDMPMAVLERHPGVGQTGEALANARRIVTLWRGLRHRFGRQAMEDQGFLFGRFSVTDAMYAPVVSRFETYGVDLAALGDDGTARAYMDAILTLPAMRDWIAGAEAEEKAKAAG